MFTYVLGGWLLAFYVIPLIYMGVKSLSVQTYFDRPTGLTTDNYEFFAQNRIVLRPLWSSLRFGLLVAVTCMVIGIIVAYMVQRHMPRRLGMVVLTLMLFPFLTSYVVRIFAWISILGRDGVLNDSLLAVGIINEPLTGLLFTPNATFITVCYLLLPLMVSPIFLVLTRINPEVYEAGEDLGAGRVRHFVTVTLPLIRPGLGAGFILVFAFATGAFLEPELVGGTDGAMISNIVADYFSSIYYERGAALALIVLTIIGLVLVVVVRLLGDPREAVGMATGSMTRRVTLAARVRARIRARRDARYAEAGPSVGPDLSFVLTDRRRRRGLTDRVHRAGLLGGYVLVGATVAFLVGPLVLIIAVSFKKAPNITLPIGDMSLAWYRQLLDNPIVQDAMWATFKVGFGAAAVAATLATFGAYGIMRRRSTRSTRLIEVFVLLPLVTPPLLYGLAWLITYRLFDIHSSLWTLMIGHVTIGLPYAYLLVRTAMHSIPVAQLEAAEDLGSGHIAIVGKIVAPQAAWGILGAFVTVSVVSLNEAIVANFNAGQQSTLPLFILSQFLFRLTPEVNAASTVMLGATMLFGIVAAILVTVLMRSRRRRLAVMPLEAGT